MKHGDVFIFASGDGTISGWRPALGTVAEILAPRPSAVYKGITLVPSANGPVLLAANFAEGTVNSSRYSRTSQHALFAENRPKIESF